MPLTKFSLLKRRAGSTRADFLRHWRTTHVRVLVERAQHKSYNRRYVQVEFVALPGLCDQAFDGVAQMTPRSAEVVHNGLQKDPLYAQHVRPDEELFLDVGACVVAYCDSVDLGAADGSGAAFKALLLVRRQLGVSRGDFEKCWDQRARALLANESSSKGLLGIRQHRPLSGAVTRMLDGSPSVDGPDVIEELFFESAAALHAFCTDEAFGASFEQFAAVRPGHGSHVFATLEHLVYDEA